MTKPDIIDELLIKHEVGLCGWTRGQLEALLKKELEEWLRILENES